MIIMHGAVMGMWWAPPWLTDSHGYQNKAGKEVLLSRDTLPAFIVIRTAEISILIFDSKPITSLPCDNKAFMT